MSAAQVKWAVWELSQADNGNGSELGGAHSRASFHNLGYLERLRNRDVVVTCRYYVHHEYGVRRHGEKDCEVHGEDTGVIWWVKSVA